MNERRASPGEALLLRRWALELFTTESGPGEASWARVLACVPESWTLFLRLERCALPLQTRLKAAGAWPRLPDPIAALLRGCAMRELQCALSARAHLSDVARLADERGWKVIVLKGGAVVAAGEMIDLQDLDILLDAERVEEVALALGEAGFEATDVDREVRHQLAPRMKPNALPIEIHRFVKGIADLDAVRARARPLEQQPPLWRFCAADHLRYLLVHMTTQHPERAGRIRDLLVVAHALRSCTPADVAKVEAELASHAQAAAIRDVLRMSHAILTRARGEDALERRALCAYILAHRYARFSASHAGHPVTYRAIRLACRTRPWWHEYREYQAEPSYTIDASPPIAWLGRRVPPLGTAARHAARLPLFLAAAGVASAIVVEARRVEGAVGAIDLRR